MMRILITESALKPWFRSKVLDSRSEQHTPHRDMNQLGSVRSDPGGNEAIQLEYRTVP